MLGFDVVSELGLALDAGKLAGFVQRDGVSSIENRVTRLNEEQVKLDGVEQVKLDGVERVQ